MPDICLGFEVHQPFRINRNFEREEGIGVDHENLFDLYFDNDWNRKILERVVENCYLPSNEIILENIRRFSGEEKEFKVSFSISGVFLMQCEKWYPEVIESFQKLSDTGCVEFLDQTFYHSLASLYSSSRAEFRGQVKEHRALVDKLFNQKPRTFENTEFLYNNSISKTLDKMGYKIVFTEGARKILGWRSPHYIYKSKVSDIRTLLRDYRLSDDVAFRFSNKKWKEYPLTADKYAEWLSSVEGDCVNIFVDYETFGEHQYPGTGIHDFLRWLPKEVLRRDNLDFVTPSDISDRSPVGNIDVDDYDTVSWADVARGTDAWLGNSMQQYCFRKIKNIGPQVKKTGDEKLLKIWRLLQISDHLYYMYTGLGPSQEVHNYFSQQTPFEVFEAFTNILSDFENKVLEF
ncbi:MAG: glycoside hydrolase family 57 protein [Candidatus Hadarchaeia archaeon]